MPNTDPESYDLNTMMDRLKRRSGDDDMEDGELVTRSDGSQALRVRKRKRRSEQPQKERVKRVHVIQVTSVLVFILLILLSLGFLMVYINSSPFQQEVVDKVARSTRAEVELNQFRMNPSGANAMGLELKWPEGNMLESASFRMLSAKVSPISFFGGVMRGQELEVGSGKLTLRIPEVGMPRGGPPALNDELLIQFEQYGVRGFSMQLRVAGSRLLWLDKSEAAFTASRNETSAQLLLKGGVVDIWRWPKMSLDRGMIKFPGDVAEVVNLRLKAPDDKEGVIELSGVLMPCSPNVTSRLAIKADTFMLSGVVGDRLGGLLSGRIDTEPEMGDCEILLQMGKQPSASLLMNFRGTPARPLVAKNFPFLYGLSQTLEDEWFSQPEFEQLVRGVLVRDSKVIELRNLDFSSNKRMSMRGNLKMELAGKLSGKFEVGVASGMIATAENDVLEVMFGEPKEGFRWLTLEISGTATDPKDNFGQLYNQALAGLKEAPKVKSDGGVPSFEELTRPR